jgi:hypothetical protein
MRQCPASYRALMSVLFFARVWRIFGLSRRCIRFPHQFAESVTGTDVGLLEGVYQFTDCGGHAVVDAIVVALE